MSVDTYLKGKKLDGYRTVRRATDDGEVKVLLSPTVASWAKCEIYTKRGLTGRKVRAMIERVSCDPR